jgi:O-antigen/teichoic acid export membrane protein
VTSGLRALAGRAGWGLVDQAISSATNFVLFLLLARSVSTSELGAVTIAFSAYLLTLGASRVVSTEPLVVRYSSSPEEVQREGVRSAAGTALAMGLVAAVVVGGLGWALPGATGTALRALALVLPGLLVQDAWRFSFFALGLPARAAANDALWAVLQLGAVTWLLVTGHGTVFWLIVAWGAAGGVAGLVGIWQAGVVPVPWRAVAWLRRHRDLGLPFLGEFGATTGANELVAFTIVAVAGLEALGGFRAAHVLLGPISILLMGAGNAAVPEGVRLLAQRPDRLLPASRLLAAGLAGAAALWSMVVLVLPDGVGTAILGENWSAGRAAFAPLAVAFVLLGLSQGAGIGLRARAMARESFRVRLVVAPTGLIAKTAGAGLAGAGGASAGAAIEQVVAAGLLWRTWLRADRVARQEQGRETSPRPSGLDGHRDQRGAT